MTHCRVADLSSPGGKKFYRVYVVVTHDNNRFVVTNWGREPGPGKYEVTSFASLGECNTAAIRLATAKVNRGYVLGQAAVSGSLFSSLPQPPQSVVDAIMDSMEKEMKREPDKATPEVTMTLLDKTAADKAAVSALSAAAKTIANPGSDELLAIRFDFEAAEILCEIVERMASYCVDVQTHRGQNFDAIILGVKVTRAGREGLHVQPVKADDARVPDGPSGVVPWDNLASITVYHRRCERW